MTFQQFLLILRARWLVGLAVAVALELDLPETAIAEGLKAVTFHNKLGSQADRIARSMVLTLAFRPRITSPYASSALSFQCQVSSNASIWAALLLPSGPLNRML